MKKITKIASLIVTLLLLLSAVALANKVTVTGTGTTAAQAENEALRNAVENAVGVLVDSKTLVDKNMVLEDQIYTQSRGFVTNYTVLDRKQSGGAWQVTIEATVDTEPNSKLMNELTRLGIIDVQLRNPRIAVCVPETHISHRIPDPAGETAIIKALIDAGFSNVVAVKVPESNPLNMNAGSLGRAANEFGVDIVIVGEAFSEGAGDPAKYLPGRQSSGLEACRARVEAKMYIAKTGQIIAADGKYGSGVDNLENIAAKKALATAGKSMGEYFVAQITSLYLSRQDVKVIVYGSDFTKIKRVQTTIENVPGVKGCNLAEYAGGKGVYSVMYGGAPQALWEKMQTVTSDNLDLVEVTYNTITVRVR
ncbi:MAG: hypothetical protein IJ849_11040 [Selenomonadaceae bacterium]|nr:hypothetical protein [Selenomonadaceae bacterium]